MTYYYRKVTEDMDNFGDKTANTKMFDQMPNLKIVSTVSAGYDHLDIDYLKSRNIRIGHTPAQVADATADQGLGFLDFSQSFKFG